MKLPSPAPVLVPAAVLALTPVVALVLLAVTVGGVVAWVPLAWSHLRRSGPSRPA